MKYGIVKAAGLYLNDVLDELEEQVNSFLAEDSTVRLLGGIAVGSLAENDYHDDWYMFMQAFTYEDDEELVQAE